MRRFTAVTREVQLLTVGNTSSARILGDWLINGKDPVADLAKLGRGGQGN